MSHRPPLTDIRILLATWFGSGYVSKAPGTVGSLMALPFGYFIADAFGAIGLLGSIVLVTIIGISVSNTYMAQADEHDPGPVVIDEVAGQWLALLPIAAMLTWQGVFAAFVLFRIFDIFKPWPISWVDREVPGGLGVMLDDVLAGIAAAVCLYIIATMFPEFMGMA